MSRHTGKTTLKNYRLPYATVEQLRHVAASGDTTMTTVLVELIQLAFDQATREKGMKHPNQPVSRFGLESRTSTNVSETP